jgi:hypothetical protein
MDLKIALTADTLLLISSIWCIWLVSERSIFNPSLWWVALHAYTVTFRLIALNLGGQSLPFFGVRSDIELVNAAIASDISLLAVVVATIFEAQRNSKKQSGAFKNLAWAQLDEGIGKIISVLCLTVGTYALVKFGSAAAIARLHGVQVSAIDLGRFEQSTYPITIAGFAVQGAVIQVAMRGFTRWRIILLAILLAISSYDLARTAFVLATILAFLIYQTRRNRCNLPLEAVMGILLLGLIWFVYKPVAVAIAENESANQVLAHAQDYFLDVIEDNTAGDTQFFDMQATFMASADELGRRFHGGTILPMLYLPIPRFVWPDKPRVNEFAWELSTPLRPVAELGITPTLSGESYLNFGWTGCAVIPFLYLLGMQIAYRRISNRGITSAARWIYLVLLVCMIQVFRDGLNSLILFPFVGYLPLIGWGVISELLHALNAHTGRVGQQFALFEAKRRSS